MKSHNVKGSTVAPSDNRNKNDVLHQQSKGEDHVVSHHHRLSLLTYPSDCPVLRPCWFHAIDVPKRRPLSIAHDQFEAKPHNLPKKYAAFSVRDSKAIEAAFQRLVRLEEKQRDEERPTARRGTISTELGAEGSETGKTQVPVNEDYLFDVDVERRELKPAYWLGPIYDVRRGTWFYQDGSTQRPCDENLAAQLEEGFLKLKPWNARPTAFKQSNRVSIQQPSKVERDPVADNAQSIGSNDRRNETLKSVGKRTTDLDDQTSSTSSRDQSSDMEGTSAFTYRLFGTHMNSVVTYQDANTAWLMTDDFLSRMNFTMYQRFAGGGHYAGVKLTRGWVNPEDKPAEQSGDKDSPKTAVPGKGKQEETIMSNAMPTVSEVPTKPVETRRQTLARQMSELLEHPEQQEKQRQKRDEQEIKNDYREVEGDEQGRGIDHLVLVTHGIGQRLGLRLESINFVHDVNALRKTLKTVYADSPDLRALNAELESAATVNSRIQVLPICWRHLLDFPKRSLKQKRREHDIVDSDVDESEIPSLDDITVEGVPAVRNLVTDLALDILLYQSAVYKDHISRIVLSECNRIYELFRRRNPQFKGKISFVGHSLGSAIMFDILCKQEHARENASRPEQHRTHAHADQELQFDVSDFYALGSPIGLFQMLQGQTVAGRTSFHARGGSQATGDGAILTESFQRLHDKKSYPELGHGLLNNTAVSRPRCQQMYNIFHPTDPIAYRIEPMISAAMSALKPQPLPYTKRGIFGAPAGQAFTGIGARVSQSVSSMWSSVASNLLTRGLGYAGDPAGRVASIQSKSQAPLSFVPESRTATPKNAVTLDSSMIDQQGVKMLDGRDHGSLNNSDPPSDRAPTLIDTELETLSSGLGKRRLSASKSASASASASSVPLEEGSTGWQEAEDRAKKLRREEQKVRALNSNGRVDYAIQEGAFDINLIAAVASHLSYWTDEDVSHFMISQLLSRYTTGSTPSTKK